jgi:hypothetical protein
MPFNAANAVVQVAGGGPGGGGGSGGSSLTPEVALLVVIAWLVGALAVATIFTERADISG